MARQLKYLSELQDCAFVGMTQVEAARALGVPPSLVCRYAKNEGIKFAYRGRGAVAKGPDERSEAMRVLYKAGYTLQQIGDQYGLTRERVRQLLTKHYGFKQEDGGQAEQSRRKSANRRAERESACLLRFGCSLAQLHKVRAIGSKMMKAGVGRARTPIGAFKSQKNNAKTRGIGWELNFWQWWTVWQTSGHWESRGRGQGYVMCRKGDEGPYAVGNVFIAPATENSSVKKTKTSGLPMGVTCVRGKRFVAHRMINGEKHRLGTFDTPELAYAAYLAMAA